MKIKIEIIKGAEGECIVINGQRVAGPKPWGGGRVVQSWDTDTLTVLNAIRAPRERT